MNRKLSTYGKYFFEFYNKLDKDLQEKIDWVFELVKSVDHIPKNISNILKTRMDFLKSGLSLKVTFTEYSVFSMRVIW